MSDALVKRLRTPVGVQDLPFIQEEAADRIEELEADLHEQIEWVKSLADDLIAAEGREARLKEKLAKALQTLKDMRDDKVGFRHEKFFRRRAAAVYAELTGGKDE